MWYFVALQASECLGGFPNVVMFAPFGGGPGPFQQGGSGPSFSQSGRGPWREDRRLSTTFEDSADQENIVYIYNIQIINMNQSDCRQSQRQESVCQFDNFSAGILLSGSACPVRIGSGFCNLLDRACTF